MGNRIGIDSRMRTIVLEAGYILVSIDYRLAPETKLPAIISELEDALKWGRAEGPKLFKADPNRIAVCGGSAVSDDRQRPNRAGGFYNFCRQQRICPKEVTGWDPVVERSKFEPYMPVKNVTADYPPTLRIHGRTDTDVPFEQSALMAEEMKRHGVVHELFVIPNGEHGFGGGDPAVIARACERAREFLKQKPSAPWSVIG